MRRLEGRSAKVAQCAKLYKKLGAAGYMCFAVDQELKAMGYSVYSRENVTRMLRRTPENLQAGEITMPFYHWHDGGMTQFYKIDDNCTMQLIVHEDGTTSMQVLAMTEAQERIVMQQKTHCDNMKELERRLRENWFIIQHLRETADAEQVKAYIQWLAQQPAATEVGNGNKDERKKRRQADGQS